MSVKTITIKEIAYEALKSLQLPRESFSDTILRVARRKPLSIFFGALSKKTGERLEREVFRARKKRNEAHRARVKHIVKTFNEI